MRRLCSIAALVGVVLIGPLSAAAQSPAPAPAPAGAKPLRVATRIIPPFVMTERGELTGFSVELWNAIAREMGVASSFAVEPSLSAMFDSIAGKRADLAIAAISITAERERSYDFSQPMFEAGLQIAVPAELGWKAMVRSGLTQLVTSREFYEFLAFFALMALIPAHIVWLIERRHPESMVPKEYIRGIGASAWWVASMLFAQAMEMPSSVFGRLFALAWMSVSMVLGVAFLAMVTATMTVERLRGDIAGPDDLPGRRVATVAASTSAAYLHEHHIATTDFTNIEEAYRALADGGVDAIVYDAPILLYHTAHEGKGKLRVVGPVFRKQAYGILFPTNDPRRKAVNTALLKLREDGTHERIYQKWFGAESTEAK